MEKKYVLTLSDGNEYVIASKVVHDNKTWLYLADINNKNNLKFCYLDNDEVVVVSKDKLSEALILKLTNNMLKDLKDGIE